MPRRIFLAVLTAYVASRLLILSLLVFSSQIAFLAKDYEGTVWRTETILQAERFRPELTRMVMAGDAWWYREITLNGYEKPTADGSPSNTWAFFPLYPRLIGLLDFASDFALTGVVISNLCLLVGLLAVAAFSLQSGGEAEATERAITYMAFFPTSYFFSIPLTESLFLALTAGAFFFASKNRWALAGVLGALSAATRVNGVLLIPALLLLPLQQKAGVRRGQLWLMLIPLGPLSFMIYLQRLTGDPFAFVRAQSLWGRTGPEGFANLVDASGLVLSRPWNMVSLNVAAAGFLLVCGAALLRRRQWSYAVYVLASAILPLASGSVQSVARYAVVVFPAFLWLGDRAENRSVDRLILAVFAILLGWLVAFFTLRVDFAFT